MLAMSHIQSNGGARRFSGRRTATPGACQRRRVIAALLLLMAAATIARATTDERSPTAAACLLEDPQSALEQQRQALRTLARSLATPPPIARLPELLAHADQRIQELAAVVAVRGATPSPGLTELAAFCRTREPRALRSLVDAAPRPLPGESAIWIDELLRRHEPGIDWVAIDALAKLEPSAAERRLLTAPLDDPDRFDPRHRLAALARVGSTEARLQIASALTKPDIVDSARDALGQVLTRLLSSGAMPEAAALLAAAHAHAPADEELLLRWCLVSGVYEADAVPANRALAEELARHGPGLTPQDSRATAELLLARAVVQWFAGDRTGAEPDLQRAASRIGVPVPRARPAAITRSRILLVHAILRIADGRGDAADALLDTAVGSAPYERFASCHFDEALDGVFGPLTVLDLIRRRLGPAIQLEFYDRLQLALRRGDGLLGVPIVDVTTAPSAEENEQVKSWTPWYQVQAMLLAGELDAAIAIATQVADRLQPSEVFDSRLLAAQARQQVGTARLLQLDADAAESALRQAIDRLEELDRTWLESDLKEARGRFPSGAPPYRRPLARPISQAWADLAEAYRLRHGRHTAEAVDALQRAVAIDPWNDRALVDLGVVLAAGADRERAQRIYRSLPRTAELLLPLARLAAALEHRDEAEALFDQHLSWNALTAARRAIEIARRSAAAEF